VLPAPNTFVAAQRDGAESRIVAIAREALAKFRAPVWSGQITNRADLLMALVPDEEREREIFFGRRLKDDPSTLDLLSRRYGNSRERVRQIEVRAFEKVQKAVRNAALDQAIAA